MMSHTNRRDSKYIVDRAPGHFATRTLFRHRLRLDFGTPRDLAWTEDSTLSILDDEYGIRIVAGVHEDALAETEVEHRNGKREICVPARTVREHVAVDAHGSVAIYERTDALHIVPANPDPLVARAREQGGDR